MSFFGASEKTAPSKFARPCPKNFGRSLGYWGVLHVQLPLKRWTKPCATDSEHGSVFLSADTNVLIRLLVSDDLAQQRAVAARLENVENAGGAVFVSLLVLAEMSWVLESTYAYERDDVARSVEAILTTSPFVVDERTLVLDALSAFRKGGPGFADHLLLAVARARRAIPLLTFDRKLLRQAGCEKP